MFDKTLILHFLVKPFSVLLKHALSVPCVRSFEVTVLARVEWEMTVSWKSKKVEFLIPDKCGKSKKNNFLGDFHHFWVGNRSEWVHGGGGQNGQEGHNLTAGARFMSQNLQNPHVSVCFRRNFFSTCARKCYWKKKHFGGYWRGVEMITFLYVFRLWIVIY